MNQSKPIATDQAAINEAEWRDPSNWRYGAYNSVRDTRVWVRKQIPALGWTLNFAHAAAYVWLAAILTPAVVLFVWLRWFSGAVIS